MPAIRHFFAFATTIGLLGASCATAQPISPMFQEQAIAADLNHSYEGGWEYYVGGGVASFDCNSDGLPELFLAGGTDPAQLMLNTSKPGGALAFQALPSGLSGETAIGVIGAYPLELDNDGNIDLVVLRRGQNILLRGQGGCQFERANEAMNFDGGTAWSTSASVIVEPGRDLPTIAIGNYIDEAQEGAPFKTCHDNRLVRGRRNDAGAVVYDSVEMLTPGYCALSILFTDWNGDGDFDLRVSNDRQYHVTGEEQLWDINSDGAGTPRLYERADGWEQLVIWGMGIAEGDLDADGRPEYALTSMMDTKIQQLDGAKPGPAYTDIAFGLGATAHRPYTGDNSKGSTGWHSQFADVNNDGQLDLYIAKGNVHQMPEFAAYDPDNLLLGNGAAPMVEAGKTSGINIDARGRGAVVEDLNADGLLDLVVVNREAPVAVLRNTSQNLPGAFRIALSGGADNPLALGAKLKLTLPDGTIQRRTVAIGGGHASGQFGAQHFGSGGHEMGDLTVTWSDGEEQQFRVVLGQVVDITKR